MTTLFDGQSRALSPVEPYLSLYQSQSYNIRGVAENCITPSRRRRFVDVLPSVASLGGTFDTAAAPCTLSTLILYVYET